MSATLHDIGKLGIPSDILMKAHALHDAERALIRMHPVWGAEIMEGVEFPWPVSTIIRQHHERLDGSGYPDGLRGDDILVEAQIIAAADTIDAVASHRPYKPGQGLAVAKAELKGLEGTQFDPAIVDACVHLLDASDHGYNP